MLRNFRFRWAVVAAALTAYVVFPAAAQSARDQLPPLIDRELIFGDPEIAGAQLSPDGRHLAFLKPYNGTRNIWVKLAEEPFEHAKPITADTKRPIPAFFWSRDGRSILFVQDQGGDENYNVYAVDPSAAGSPDAGIPVARNLTDAKGARAFIYAVPKSRPDAIFVGLNERDQAWHDLYEVSISTGERKLLRTNTDRITGWVFDLKDQLRLATRVTEDGDTEVLRVDEKDTTAVYSCGVFESCEPVRFHKDGRRVYMITNKGHGVDLTRLVLLDIESGREELVESDPEGRVDFGGARFSERTDELLFITFVDERRRVYWKDKAFEADARILEKTLPGKDLTFGSSTDDENVWLVTARSDTEPGETHLFNRRSKQLTLQYRLFDKLPRQHLAPMTAIRYPSSDGLEIPAYLTVPKGVSASSLPVIVVPHGGPWTRDYWGYDPLAQFLANRGYAVLQPNFRGSTGYGKEFLDAGNRQWGDKMQDDLTWGAKHLVGKGLADSKRIGILGGSYGGYATLAGLAFTPDVYAAGVSIVGPSNLITLLESIPPYWEAVRKLFYERMGDPNTAEGRKQLERQSPLNSASKIQAPLLVIQGANDPRVKKAESDQIVVALRDRGFPVEYIVAPDEGHGFARPVNNMAAFAATEKFLARHLGGRYQEDMTAPVAERLKAITVDPKTVEKPKIVAPSSVSMPKPETGLKPGTSSYAAQIDVGGQLIEITMTSVIAEEGGHWIATETAQTPMGESFDRTVIEKGTLAVLKRSATQGPSGLEFEVKDGKAVGQIKIGEQSRPISVELGGSLFADGAGAFSVLAALPLTEGYTASFRNLDVQTFQVLVLHMKVTGSETVSVPAGSFAAYRVEIESPGDGTRMTAWISKADRTVAKTITVSPRMNGATITAQLVK
jgi:dipeptidyl aminopeptidase/acylaminoacyl peptidase